MKLNLLPDPLLTWDNLEPVKIQSTRVTGSAVDGTVLALRRQATYTEGAPSGGSYQRGALTWLIPANQVVVGPLEPGDLVSPVDGSGQDFTALTVDLAAGGSFWRLQCVDLVIANNLQDTVNIERADILYDAAGTPVKLFPPDGGRTLYTALPCRVQEQDAETAEERGIRGEAKKFTVYVAKQLNDLNTAEDRILVVQTPVAAWKGKYLERLVYRNPNQLGELPQIEAVLTI